MVRSPYAGADLIPGMNPSRSSAASPTNEGPAVIVDVHLYSQSTPIRIERVRNTYTKGPLYCVMLLDSLVVYKFPVEHIFRITETP